MVRPEVAAPLRNLTETSGESRETGKVNIYWLSHVPKQKKKKKEKGGFGKRSFLYRVVDVNGIQKKNNRRMLSLSFLFFPQLYRL